MTAISIHALLAESDTERPVESRSNILFLSTLSLRRATVSSTGATKSDQISIHALLAESDRFNPFKTFIILAFLSTLSLRRATSIEPIFSKINTNFYPRSPCGERRSRPRQGPDLPGISIHALLAESDNRQPIFSGQAEKFLSTLSLRRATYDTYAKVLRVNISIHALLAESDVLVLCSFGGAFDFYPRSPCGERRRYLTPKALKKSFLSTLSLRRATEQLRQKDIQIAISIHALLAESD